MKFKTTFDPKPFPFNVGYNDKLLFLGSCFAENISAYFERFKFQVVKNPFGILYNPNAIFKSIDLSIHSEIPITESSFEFNGIWSNYNTHSILSSVSKAEHFLKLEKAKSDLSKALKESNFIFISLGTAWAYKHISSKEFVANCHKLPQNHFKKELFDVETVNSILKKIIDNISTLKPDAKIIFTLSPVRHLKDGFVENQMSKSTLHLAIQHMVKNHEQAFYFPSYELLLDDLRDYRFYDSDFVHPNLIALDYIWTKIENLFFDDNTLQLMDKVDKINKRLAHRFFNPEHPEANDFQNKTENLILQVMQIFPFIKF